MPLKRLGDILLSEHIITDKQLKDALHKQKEGERLGETLVQLGYVTEMQILKALESPTGVSRISLANVQFDERVLTLLPEDFCRRNHVFPLKMEGKTLHFAISDPLDFAIFEEIRLLTGLRPKAFSSPKNDIISQIERYYGFSRTLEALGVKEGLIHEEVLSDQDDEETPMIKLVNQLLTAAVFQRASDIHIDPLDDKVLVRYRVDGALDAVRELPLKIHQQMVSRIKVMSGLDITETRVPQDGRIQTSIQQKSIDLRISTLPTVRGEKIVMRILDLSGTRNKLSSLGLDGKDLLKVKQLIQQPNGIILVTGPTGSGKTTTLYAFLNELNQPDVNIVTVEDPVEIKVEGINQVQVHPEVHLTFATALRSILRQDPNIVMVGEIRDVETAEIAIRASLTGHLVLSTIHTNNAVKTITRLMDMNIEPFMLASSLSGILSQRLVRKLCPECSYLDEPMPSEIVIFKQNGMEIEHVKRAKGCPSCNFRGYAGRIGIFEVLPITSQMQDLIAHQASIKELEKQALKDGMRPLMLSGLSKIEQGLTTLEEVMKVVTE